MKKKGLLAIATLFILFAGLFFSLWWWPHTQVQAYLEIAGGDFKKVQSEVSYFEGSFVEVSDSLKNSKGAFYEIIETRTYEDSKTDTAKDIEEITTTLKLIDEAQAKLAELDPPTQAEPLARRLETYYSQAETGLELLLKHEQFQLELLKASGDELHQSLDRTLHLLQSGGSRGETIYYMMHTAKLAKAAADRIEPMITPITPETKIFEPTWAQHYAFYVTFEYCARMFALGTTSGDDACIDKLLYYMAVQDKMVVQRQEIMQKWVDESPIKKAFADSVRSEEIIKQALEANGRIPKADEISYHATSYFEPKYKLSRK